MTLEFKQEQISTAEKRNEKPYIGYFTPNGKLVDYNTMFGEPHHDAWQNPVSQAFLSFISYIIKDTSIEKLKKIAPYSYQKNKYPGLNEYVIRGYGVWYDYNSKDIDTFLNLLNLIIENLKYDKNLDIYEKFEYDLLLFFKKAYCNKTFFDTINRKIYVANKNSMNKTIAKEYQKNITDKEVDNIYREYLIQELMSHFKDICVQYLWYDSIERFTPTGQAIKIPSQLDFHHYDFLNIPRIITTSCPNPNERYYNYLAMNWVVHKIPRYFFNKKTMDFETDSFLENYVSEKEQRLEKELKSLKKCVPLEKRPNYFR